MTVVDDAISHVYTAKVAHQRRLASLDLNLLRTLDALLHEQSVTRAAARLGVSQPAVSASLARLRRHFGDELLARSGATYQLTPLAAELVSKTEAAIVQIEKVFSAEPEFDPALSEREFIVVASDYAIRIIGPSVAEVLRDQGPGIRLRFRQITADTVDRAADTLRDADAIMLPHGWLSDLPYLDLYRDDWVCLVSAENAPVGDKISLEALGKLPWVVTFHEPTAFSMAQRQLRMLGVEPQVRFIVESYLTVPPLVAAGGCVTLLQQKLAARIPRDAGVRILTCPFDAVPVVEALWWHPIYARDAGHVWLRQVFAEAGRRV
jgi:DNA-binding transcriptional LysR family regulator